MNKDTAQCKTANESFLNSCFFGIVWKMAWKKGIRFLSTWLPIYTRLENQRLRVAGKKSQYSIKATNSLFLRTSQHQVSMSPMSTTESLAMPHLVDGRALLSQHCRNRSDRTTAIQHTPGMSPRPSGRLSWTAILLIAQLGGGVTLVP